MERGLACWAGGMGEAWVRSSSGGTSRIGGCFGKARGVHALRRACGLCAGHADLRRLHGGVHCWILVTLARGGFPNYFHHRAPAV